MKRSTSTLLTLGLALGATACGDQPTNEDYDDLAVSVASVLADDSGSELEAVGDAVDAAQGALPSGMTRSGAGTLTGQRGQLQYTYEITCQDAAGATQAACGDQTTDAARLVLSWTGTIDTARRHADLSRDGDWTFTGLTGEVATLDGDGHFDIASEFQALTRPLSRSFAFTYDATYSGVRIRLADRMPVGGAASYAIHAERTTSRRLRDVEAVFDVTADVSFGEDGHATVVLDGARTYDVDLATGVVALAE